MYVTEDNNQKAYAEWERWMIGETKGASYVELFFFFAGEWLVESTA